MIRRVAAAAGIAFALAGFALLAVPATAASLTTSRLVLLAIAALAVLQGARVAADRYRTGVTTTVPDEAEGVRDLPRPGRWFRGTYRTLSRYSTFERQGIESEVREDLESLAVEILCRVEDCSPERARELLATGDWTDDPAAAAFFDEAVRGRTAVGWVRAVAGRDDRFERRVDSVVRELAALVHHDDRAPDDADEEGDDA